MPESLVHESSPLLFFREQLLKAMEHQRIATSAFTEHYLVNLLTAFARGEALPTREPGYDETPLALLYLRALEASRWERAQLLRTMGDTALFVSGFFGESLAGKEGDLRYYATLGGRAYARLSHDHEQGSVVGPAVFSELAQRFRDFADVLAEVSELSRLAHPASVVRLYERWVQTGSRRAAALLAAHGITPGAPGDGTVH
jgi:hypothetical protein